MLMEIECRGDELTLLQREDESESGGQSFSSGRLRIGTGDAEGYNVLATGGFRCDVC